MTEEASSANAPSPGGGVRLWWVVAALALLLGYLALHYAAESRQAADLYKTAVNACQLRGVDYFKSMGAYPTMSDGRSASEVSEDRCKRNTRAF